jgi:hypothetical protein
MTARRSAQLPLLPAPHRPPAGHLLGGAGGPAVSEAAGAAVQRLTGQSQVLGRCARGSRLNPASQLDESQNAELSFLGRRPSRIGQSRSSMWHTLNAAARLLAATCGL